MSVVATASCRLAFNVHLLLGWGTNQRVELGEKFATLSQLLLHIVEIKFDKSDIVPFLPVFKELVVETTPLCVKKPCFDKLTMESRANTCVFL